MGAGGRGAGAGGRNKNKKIKQALVGQIIVNSHQKYICGSAPSEVFIHVAQSESPWPLLITLASFEWF